MIDRDEPLFGDDPEDPAPGESPPAPGGQAPSGPAGRPATDPAAGGPGDPPASGSDDASARFLFASHAIDPADAADADRPRRASQPAARAGARGSFWRELPVLLLVALVLAFLLRTFVVQVFYIPSSSMEPTLRIDDRMVVEKVTFLFRDPQRGDVVVFEGDEDADGDVDRSTGERIVRGVGQFLGVVPTSARDFVKRVIGLPGDEVEITEGVVRVNGEVLDEPYVAFDDPSDYGPVTVPEGTLFFLGDNRPNSSDSRRGLGFVPLDRVVGRAVVIIWPLDHTGLLTGVEHDLGAPAAAAVDGGGPVPIGVAD
jgi:signal peptidase I